MGGPLSFVSIWLFSVTSFAFILGKCRHLRKHWRYGKKNCTCVCQLDWNRCQFVHICHIQMAQETIKPFPDLVLSPKRWSWFPSCNVAFTFVLICGKTSLLNQPSGVLRWLVEVVWLQFFASVLCFAEPGIKPGAWLLKSLFCLSLEDLHLLANE